MTEARIIPATAARTITSCGPLGCPHFSGASFVGQHMCNKALRLFDPDKGAAFPEWCPLAKAGA